MDDLISRQTTIDAVLSIGHIAKLTDGDAVIRMSAVNYVLRTLPSAEPETCEGCKHLGKWENEVEYGYPSPCTRCKRRVEDRYER